MLTLGVAFYFFTNVAQNYVYTSVANQIIKDNKVIGTAILGNIKYSDKFNDEWLCLNTFSRFATS